MIKVGILPAEDIIDILKTFETRVNKVQNEFNIIVYSTLEKSMNPPLEIESLEGFNLLNPLKINKYNLSKYDSLVFFTKAILSVSEEGLTNLFYDTSNQNTSIVSLKFLEWDIIKGQLTKELKFHAIAHLLIALLIETYPKLLPHDETKGCLMDFCNNLQDFNAMLAHRYYLCEECSQQIVENKLRDPIIKILTELRREEGYSESVLVIGSYNNEGNIRLEQIKNKLSILGYQPQFVKDIPDRYHGSRERKFLNLACQSHFIICENSFPSGHIDELKICVQCEFITCIIQETNHIATSMQAHYHTMYNFINFFCYGTRSNINRHICKHVSKNLNSCVEQAVKWAENVNKRIQEDNANINPNG